MQVRKKGLTVDLATQYLFFAGLPFRICFFRGLGDDPAPSYLMSTLGVTGCEVENFVLTFILTLFMLVLLVWPFIIGMEITTRLVTECQLSLLRDTKEETRT